jgi:hypothetical protein
MRTGIYVYAPTTLTIHASEPVVLVSLDNRSIAFGGGTVSTAVSPGIYKAVTDSAITVTGSSIDVVVVSQNKDPWPDPPLAAASAFNVTTTYLKRFFAMPDPHPPAAL